LPSILRVLVRSVFSDRVIMSMMGPRMNNADVKAIPVPTRDPRRV
jgi:hypothetical protein